MHTPAPMPGVPRDHGYRVPAEWEPHEATWLVWPHSPDDWPGKIETVRWAYTDWIRHLARGERVRLLTPDADTEAEARMMLLDTGTNLERVDWIRCATNSSWIRDFGPVFLRRENEPRIALSHFAFTAWARYPHFEKDAAVPLHLAQALGAPRYAATRPEGHIVLEGGSLEFNGLGTLITTEECLLDPAVQVRNPDMTRTGLERVFHDYLGIEKTIWLGGGIDGDDTHGHVDDLCRFVDATTVVLCREDAPDDVNYRPLQENRERLEGATLADGTRIEVVDLPMPRPLHFRGMRLPASYANFYIANAAVLVPTFNDPNDRIALGILSDLFPEREVVGIHASDLVWGQGTLHCLSCQQPRPDCNHCIEEDGPCGPGA